MFLVLGVVIYANEHETNKKITKQKYIIIIYWVVPEKIHTPPTDGILEILAGGGVEESGNPGGRGG